MEVGFGGANPTDSHQRLLTWTISCVPGCDSAVAVVHVTVLFIHNVCYKHYVMSADNVFNECHDTSGQESIRLPKILPCDRPLHQETWSGGWASGQWQCVSVGVGRKGDWCDYCIPLCLPLTVHTVHLNRAILAVWTVWSGMSEESKSSDPIVFTFCVIWPGIWSAPWLSKSYSKLLIFIVFCV